MRLTLRTLLAYLDDTLPPAAAKEIGQKLTESPVAQELVTRIREVTRRRRIVAPSLSGDDINPNELAEYLDNLLTPGAVEVVENVCLQSDIHLAEAAACHQILTMIGQPAPVSSEARRRMYDLVREPELEPSPPQPEPRPAAKVLPLASIFSQRPLLARILSIAAVVLGTLVIGGLIWVSLKVPEQGTAKPDEKQVATADQSVSDEGIFQPNVLPTESRDIPPPKIPTVKPVAIPAPESTSGQKPGVESAPSDQGVEEPAGKKPEDKRPDQMPAKAEPVQAESTPGDSAPAGSKPANPPASGAGKEPSEAAPQPPAAPAEPIPLGVYSSTTGVLMRYDRANQKQEESAPSAKGINEPAGKKPEDKREWRRIPARSVVSAQDALLGLPTYRSILQLTGGFSVELVGETELILQPPAEGVHVRIQLDRGRIVLGTNSEPATFQVDFLDQSWAVTLKGPETVAAIELAAPWKAGRPSVYEAALYLPRGEAQFQSRERADQLGGPVQLRWSSVGGFRDRESLAVSPAWLEKEELSLQMQKASENMQRKSTIPDNASAVLPLIECMGDDRRETRVLAVQFLGAIGRLPALIDAMNTPEKREVRTEAIKALRQYMARGPAQEAALSDALVAKLNISQERALNLLRLLSGFTDDEAKQQNTYDVLISLLDSPDLAVRELAINNLEELAGKPATVNYSPDNRTENAINAWRRFLDEKRLPPKTRGKM